MGRLPSKDLAFLAFARNIAEECLIHKTAWRLDTGEVEYLQSLTNEADAAYANIRNSETSTHLARVTKKMNFLMLRQFLRPFINMLTANKAISDDVLIAMGLSPRVVPPPAEAPKLNVRKIQHLEITVGVSALAPNRSNASFIKKSYYGFILRYRLEEETEWHEVYSTKRCTTLYFNSGDEGKHITLTAAWLNSCIQRGPWSNEVISLIN
ncbi:MAG: hypothetical protein LBG31_03010 [Prevotellaceae bacterium]|jgi:hypothetical protein|nr:hypothetical protein [Prevotellaceae bacterium]